MTTYRVLCDNYAGKNPGDTLTAEDLDGLNVEPLVESGAIESIKTTKKEAE